VMMIHLQLWALLCPLCRFDSPKLLQPLSSGPSPSLSLSLSLRESFVCVCVSLSLRLPHFLSQLQLGRQQQWSPATPLLPPGPLIVPPLISSFRPATTNHLWSA
jgi:hypothetical protein